MKIVILMSLLMSFFSIAEIVEIEVYEPNNTGLYEITDQEKMDLYQFTCEGYFLTILNNIIPKNEQRLLTIREIISNENNYEDGRLKGDMIDSVQSLLRQNEGYRLEYYHFDRRSRNKGSGSLAFGIGNRSVPFCAYVSPDHPLVNQIFDKLEYLDEMSIENAKIECRNAKKTKEGILPTLKSYSRKILWESCRLHLD